VMIEDEWGVGVGIGEGGIEQIDGDEVDFGQVGVSRAGLWIVAGICGKVQIHGEVQGRRAGLVHVTVIVGVEFVVDVVVAVVVGEIVFVVEVVVIAVGVEVVVGILMEVVVGVVFVVVLVFEVLIVTSEYLVGYCFESASPNVSLSLLVVLVIE
jgi:hypothetical protein